MEATTAAGRIEIARLAESVADGTADASAVSSLRAAGPPGLAALTAQLDAAPTDAARVARLAPAIDQVAKQKDASAARLYWYTDLDAAKDAAKAIGRPILSLRLLGNLDEELSCANSRFFRTALYSNGSVATYLRDHFVLHWSSERPAPLMTIDFGDGRKLQRTVTGNSLHYVLDAEGRPLDAIPGLYGPAAFLAALSKAEDLARRTRDMGAGDREASIEQFHSSELLSLVTSWRSMLVGAGVSDAALFALPQPIAGAKAPPATLAAPIAYAKAAVEMPAVIGMMPSMLLPEDRLPWAKITANYAGTAKLEPGARSLIRAKNPMDWTDPSAPKKLDDAAFGALITSFENLMVGDTVRNEFRNHAKIHEWFIGKPDTSLKELNTRVYTELFLTPKSDPWLGLVPPGVYSGIADDGIVAPK
ncbi:hypothetical protein BH09MYX1_BH09MYX1_12990 [soil metagenome]